jgi:ribosome-associated protein
MTAQAGLTAAATTTVTGIDTQAKAVLAARAAIAKHAEDVLVLDVRKLSSVTDWFVIGTVHSAPQVRGVREEIETAMQARGQRLWHVEGETEVKRGGPGQDGSPQLWVLLDCGDVLIHLFNPPARQFYQLERLWGDAPQIPLDPAG